MLGKYNRRTVRASSGAVAPGATVSFFWQSNGTPAMVYADQNGSNPLGSSVQSDADGRIAVFVTPGLYRIVTTLDGDMIDEITHEPIVGQLSYGDPDSYALRSDLKLHDEDIQLVAKSVTDLKLAGGPRMASGRVLSADEIGMLADTGAMIKTTEYHDGTSVGGAEYQLRTRASYRTEIGDAAWVPNGIVEHYLLGGTVFVAVAVSDGNTNSRKWGLPGVMSPQQRAATIQTMWEWCAVRGIEAVMCDDTFEVARNTSTYVLMSPSNFNCHFQIGAKLVNKTFEYSPSSVYCRVLACGSENIYRENIKITGVVEIDGGYSGFSDWYLEHNHGLFCLNCKNVEIESVISNNCMGDCATFSGFAPGDIPQFAVNVSVGKLEAGLCGRKSLVIESTNNLWIGTAWLNNGASNCLDYEPFSVINGHTPITARIDNLLCRSGIDFSAGSSADVETKSCLSIGSCVVRLNASFTGNAFFTDAVNLQVQTMVIDGRESLGVQTMLAARHAARLNFSSLTILIPDNYALDAINCTTPGSPGGVPVLTANVVHLEGHGRLRVALASGQIHADLLRFRCTTDGGGLKYNQTVSHVLVNSLTTVAPAALKVRTIEVVNSRAVSVLDSFGGSMGRYQDTSVGSIICTDTTTDVALPAVLSVRGLVSHQHLNIIGGVSYMGQAPAAFWRVEAGGVRVYKTSGGHDTPSSFILDASTPEAIVPAKRGSTCIATGGLYYKTVDDVAGTTTEGWALIS